MTERTQFRGWWLYRRNEGTNPILGRYRWQRAGGRDESGMTVPATLGCVESRFSPLLVSIACVGFRKCPIGRRCCLGGGIYETNSTWRGGSDGMGGTGCVGEVTKRTQFRGGTGPRGLRTGESDPPKPNLNEGRETHG